MNKNSTTVEHIAFLIGSFFIFLMAAVITVSMVSFILGAGISFIQIVIASALSFAGLYVYGRKLLKDKKRLVLTTVSILLILLVSLFAAGFFMDISYDGRLYHQKTVIRLTDGWNPVYEYADKSKAPNIWTRIYPKAGEICAANVYALTGRMETGKVFNILLLVSSFFLSAFALLKIGRLKKNSVLFVGVLLAVNPVTLCQVFSFYIDGLMASLLVCMFALVVVLIKEYRPVYAAVLSFVVMLTVNTKFTGLIYSVAMIAGLMLGLLLKNKDIKGIIKPTLTFLSAGIVGVFLLGFNPYVTNFIQTGDPLFKYSQPQKRERFMREHRPADFHEKSGIERLFLSIIARSEGTNITGPYYGHYKIPFTFSKEEITHFRHTGVRLGGWGPLFGGIFLLSLIFLITGFFIDRQTAKPFIFLFMLLTFSIVINAEAWWARFAPHVWLFPFIAVVYLFYTENKIFRKIRYLLPVLLLINVLLIAGAYVPFQVDSTLAVKKKLAQVAMTDRPVYVRFGKYITSRLWLEERGIEYISIKELPANRKIHDLGAGISFHY